MVFTKEEKKAYNLKNNIIKKQKNKLWYHCNKDTLNLIKANLYIKTTQNINILYS